MNAGEGSHPEESGVQRADPLARRRAVLLIAATAVGGTVAILATQRWLDGMRAVAEHDPHATAVQVAAVLRVAALVAPLPILLFAIYGFRLASRIRASLRFPPPGLAVTRDTTILLGDAALRRARHLTVVLVFLVVAAIGLSVMIGKAADLVVDLAGRAPSADSP